MLTRDDGLHGTELDAGPGATRGVHLERVQDARLSEVLGVHQSRIGAILPSLDAYRTGYA